MQGAAIIGGGTMGADIAAIFAHAGWTAHCLEQAQADILIRPDVRYVGPAERALPGVVAGT